MILVRVVSLCAVMLLAMGARSLSATPVITFDQLSGTSASNGNQSVGWQFDVLESLLVTGLGWYDEGLDGLGRSHTVGIWDPGGSLLTSIVVPSGTGAALDGVYRTMAIAPLLLTPGAGYIVGGENFSDAGDRPVANVTQVVDPRIAYVNPTFSATNSGFVRPTVPSAALSGFYGPMFSVSEPSTFTLIALAGLLFLVRRREKG